MIVDEIGILQERDIEDPVENTIKESRDQFESGKLRRSLHKEYVFADTGGQPRNGCGVAIYLYFTHSFGKDSRSKETVQENILVPKNSSEAHDQQTIHGFNRMHMSFPRFVKHSDNTGGV